jgi:hypothetical protein
MPQVDFYHEHHTFIPWTLVRDGQTLCSGLLLAAIPTVAYLVRAAKGRASAPPTQLPVALIGLGLVGLAGLAATLFLLTLLPTGLALTYPYYDTAMDYGGLVACAGFVALALGRLALLPSRGGSQ